MTNHKSVLPDLLDLGPLLADDGAALRRGHAQPQHQRPRVGGFTENQSEVSIVVDWTNQRSVLLIPEAAHELPELAADEGECLEDDIQPTTDTQHPLVGPGLRQTGTDRKILGCFDLKIFERRKIFAAPHTSARLLPEQAHQRLVCPEQVSRLLPGDEEPQGDVAPALVPAPAPHAAHAEVAAPAPHVAAQHAVAALPQPAAQVAEVGEAAEAAQSSHGH